MRHAALILTMFGLFIPATAGERTSLPEPAPIEAIDLSSVAVASPAMRPNLSNDSPDVTVSIEGKDNLATGRCRNGARVVIAAATGTAMTICENARYEAKAPEGAELTVSQLFVDGEIIYARVGPDQPPGRTLSLAQLNSMSANLDGHFTLEPGTFVKQRIILRDDEAGTERLVIDGAGKVTLQAGTTIDISRANVTLQGLRFEDDVSIIASAPGFRLFGSDFRRCGKHGATQSHCVLIGPGASMAEVAFNRFTGSQSMSIKVRAGNADSHQPVKTYIHHNAFRDIERLSGNGQEVIQLAGPGGGASSAALDARIEHNLFVATSGDVEAISIKTPAVAVRWNSFMNMDAAPNIRGATDALLAGNILIRTRPIRVAGARHVVASNIILCPKGPGIMLLDGSNGYEAARRNRIEGNTVVSTKAAIVVRAMQRPVTLPASENAISRNVLVGNDPQLDTGLSGAAGNKSSFNVVNRMPVCR